MYHMQDHGIVERCFTLVGPLAELSTRYAAPKNYDTIDEIQMELKRRRVCTRGWYKEAGMIYTYSKYVAKTGQNCIGKPASAFTYL